MRYLDPKADILFKKVFGEQKTIVKAFLNAMLPLEEHELIEEIFYETPEMSSLTPDHKYSIVDVHCTDVSGRHFVVEMQQIWSSEFTSRVVFNSCKAYVRQAGKGFRYSNLKPVYSLNLMNQNFLPEEKGFYHHYKIVHKEHTEEVIKGLEYIFIELPKFRPQDYNTKKMQVLWLRFLTEIDENTRNISEDMLAIPEIRKAIETVEESSLNDAERRAYDKYWDSVRNEITLLAGAEEKGEAKGIAKGIAIGEAKRDAEIAKRMIAKGLTNTEITDFVDLSEAEIEALR